MELSLYHNGIQYSFNTLHPIDISIPVRHDGKGTNCFYTDRPFFKSYRSGDFVGDVREGGVCNVDTITFTPHGNGTHTECIGHITEERQTIIESLKQGIMVASLVTVTPDAVKNDKVITLEKLEGVEIHPDVDAVIVRTLPNGKTKLSTDYSGSNPAYFAPQALEYLKTLDIKHLVCDIPSVDREDDGGNLLAHKAFFGMPDLPRTDVTITELAYIPSEIEDGLYLLDLQIGPFQSDASPSRPIIYSMKAVF